MQVKAPGGFSWYLASGKHQRGNNSPPSALKKIEKAAEVKAGTDLKALKKEINSLKGELKTR
jgi:hypothetical protein